MDYPENSNHTQKVMFNDVLRTDYINYLDHDTTAFSK